MRDIPILLGSALIKGGLPSPFSMQQLRIPLINQGNYRLFLDKCSVALKADQGFTQTRRAKLAQVTQLQAIEEKFKHLKFSEIWNFYSTFNVPLQCMNHLYISLDTKNN